MEVIYFLETGHFQPMGRAGGWLIWAPRPKIIFKELDWPSKYHYNPCIPSKFNQNLHLDRQVQAIKFYALFWCISLHDICFAHLWRIRLSLQHLHGENSCLFCPTVSDKKVWYNSATSPLSNNWRRGWSLSNLVLFDIIHWGGLQAIIRLGVE